MLLFSLGNALMKLIAPALLSCLLAAASEAAEFRNLTAEIIGSFPYNIPSPVVRFTTVSGDGSTIGGTLTATGVDFECVVFDCYNSGFVWSIAENRPVPLKRMLLPGWPDREAYPRLLTALSFDGTSAVALFENGSYYESGLQVGNETRAFRDPIEFGDGLVATAISSDGATVTGIVGQAPFRWTNAEGIMAFSGIEAGSGYRASAISGDGAVSILTEEDPLGNVVVSGEHTKNALSWTADSGVLELVPSMGSDFSYATALSHDGKIVVGGSYSNPNSDGGQYQATRWSDGAPSVLSSLEFRESFAEDVTADGNTIVGMAASDIQRLFSNFRPTPAASEAARAVLWRDGEAHLLEDLLANEYGLGDELAGWKLTSATAISDDGNVIAGQGIDPEGNQSAWVAILSVPEPSGLLIIAGLVGLALVSGRR